jgi:hypothetical protein
MLKSAVCALLILFVSGCAGSLTRLSEADKKIHAKALIPHQSQQQLLAGTRTWMEKQFTDRPDSISSDQSFGEVISAVGRIDYDCAWLECLSKGDWQVYFSMRVTAYDGEIRTLFQRIRLVAPATDANSAGTLDSPLWSQRDLDNIRPALLELNRKLVRFLRQRG